MEDAHEPEVLRREGPRSTDHRQRSNGGDEAWYQSLEGDRIIVTPTLVRKKPGPKTWIVGTLAPIDAVEEMLASVLGEQGAD